MRAYYILPIPDLLRLLGLPPEADAPLVVVNQTQPTHVRVYFEHIDLPFAEGPDSVREVSPTWDRDAAGRVVWHSVE